MFKFQFIRQLMLQMEAYFILLLMQIKFTLLKTQVFLIYKSIKMELVMIFQNVKIL